MPSRRIPRPSTGPIEIQNEPRALLRPGSRIMWNEGDTVLLRGMYAGRPAYIQSTRLIRDTPAETILAIWPGAECVAPAGYLRDGHGPGSTWNRWEETLTGTLSMQKIGR